MVVRINIICVSGDAIMSKEQQELMRDWRQWIGYWIVIFGVWGTSLVITLTFS